jgi:hypothetical protein
MGMNEGEGEISGIPVTAKLVGREVGTGLK